MTDSKNDPADLSTIPVRVLIVDDDEGHAQAVADSLARINCDCKVAGSGELGAQLIHAESWDVVVTDLRMGEVDGLEILRLTKEELPDAEVIVLTGHGSIASAVTAMQHGAYTYLTKPLDIGELRSAVEKASARLRLIRRNAELRRSLDERFGFEGVIGNSPQMHSIVEILKNVAPTDSTVLIHGENGTGKELVAHALHQNSPRKNKPFVPLNISALPNSILESELFGHEAGSFTGAIGRRIGKFEHANGGTLFLDEVGEMPMDTQVKLLRVLEERKITRLGANDELPINVRLVAATNADLHKLVQDGKFREDLYYRINVVSIHLPPLRDRSGDIPLLMEHFLRDLSKRTGREVQGFSRAARKAFFAYQWPGNIRQLRNTIERMLVLDNDGVLDIDGLPPEIAVLVKDQLPDADDDIPSGADGLIGKSMTEVERYYIQRALDLTDGNREEAAKMLEIGERTLYRKIKEYELRK
ncbi:MAG TPA: sigma-54 dependent transcriptional regulator [Planctomycetaceae bacterium]|nr:sigma-54 dependent transcriptional regulator [Planctomycetaceae bacterium]HQZ65628.1 sigma-54 dependent transcriptional regulator [Planctomycetaceae bacterium]